jgi:hypothetical protein
MIRLILFSLLLGCISCDFLKSKNESCKDIKIETIFTNIRIGGRDTSYYHCVLLQCCSRDSLINSPNGFNIISNYIDTTSAPKPVGKIEFFSSTEEFIPNEKCQIWEDIYPHYLATIYIGRKKENITEYKYEIINKNYKQGQVGLIKRK